MTNLLRWLDNILYKRVRKSHAEILDHQIRKGAEKYDSPLPGQWTAKQLIRHGKEENVDQFVYYEALEIVVEKMEEENNALRDDLDKSNKRVKELEDLLVMAEKERRKWASIARY